MSKTYKMSEIIVAKHIAYAVFKIPKEYQDFPLTCFDVLRDTLFIYSEECPRKLLCEVGASLSADDAIDWKRPDEIFFANKEDFPYHTEDSDEEDDDDNKIKCSGNDCEERLVQEESYYLRFPDGTEEYYCQDCQSSLRDNYIKKAEYRGYGDGVIFHRDEEQPPKKNSDSK